MKSKIEITIQHELLATRLHCKFKEAWLPRGWACVEIKSFAKDLAEVLRRNKQ